MLFRLIPAFAVALLGLSARAADYRDPQTLSKFELQLYWTAESPVRPGDAVARIAALDDNLYLLTEENRAIAIHAPTGLVRWSVEVAPPGQTIRGPTHSPSYVVFTTTTGIRLFDRRTGLLAGEPRNLRASLIEMRGDIADINIGRLHGASAGDTLGVYRPGEVEAGGTPIAKFKIDVVRERDATGRFVEIDRGNPPQPGYPLAARVSIPIDQVQVPFSPSSAAVCDDEFVYFGAANQRFYCLTIVGGYRQWELLTPKTVTAEPVLRGESLYFGGQNGQLLKLSAKDRTLSWNNPFRTEGPIFARPTIDGDAAFVASADRSVYAVRTATGKRMWRQRFDAELLSPPSAEKDSVFQHVPGQGLVALKREDGSERWRLPDGLAFLVRIGDLDYVLTGSAGPGESLYFTQIARVEAATGKPVGMPLDLGGRSLIAALNDPPSIFLSDSMGRMACLRWSKAPYLTSAEVADALRADRGDRPTRPIKRVAVATTRPAGAGATRPDPFASPSDTPPAAGPGLVPPGADQPAEKPPPPTTETRPDKEDEEKPADEEADEKPADDEKEDKDEEKPDDSTSDDDGESEDDGGL